MLLNRIDTSPAEGSETSQKPAKRNHLFPPSLPLSLSVSLSLPLPFFPCPATRTPTPIPTPTPTITTTITTTTTPATTTTTSTSTSTASTTAAGVSFPDRFRTAQAYFAPKFDIECVHAWILTLITRLATTLSTTTTPAATAPPLPLVHLGISAFAFKSNWHESRWRVRNQSETSQKPAKRNHLFPPLPPSLSLSFSLSLPLPFFPCPATRTPTPIPTPTPTLTPTTTTTTTTITTTTTNTNTNTTTITSTTSTTSTTAAGATVSFPGRFRTAQAYFAPKFEIECVHAWILTLITGKHVSNSAEKQWYYKELA